MLFFCNLFLAVSTWSYGYYAKFLVGLTQNKQTKHDNHEV